MEKEKRSVHSLCDWNARQLNRGARGLFEFSGYTFVCSADCGRYGEVTLRAGTHFTGRCRCREVAAVRRLQ